MDRVINRQTGKDYIIAEYADVILPDGWEEVSAKEELRVPEKKAEEPSKAELSEHLQRVARRVEKYIDRAENQYHVSILAAYISIDADTTFHITMLIKQEDYHSPEFLAAKLAARQYLTTLDDLSIRFTFTIAEEYYRSGQATGAGKPQYVYNVASHTDISRKY